ncbi:helicase RepA family protein [Christensenellaceae bacterium OttesenSCG-928-L17]|nr:helicase RepA family protein [Christensenellaceae bacterium OttesenSCG-928-L17]
MTIKEKSTAPIPPVGADGEQPLSQNYNPSIADESTEINGNLGFDELMRWTRQYNDPSYMNTFSMNELYENVYESRPPVIDGLLYTGTYLFVGAPKVGKSFLMAQLAYHVSTGEKLWDYEVSKGTVLYLALEDTPKRLQERLFRMFGTESTENLHFTTAGAKQVGCGLDEQLRGFVQKHPDTKLIIIDTLQKIRESGSDKFSYANDYELVGKLKQFADNNHLCLLLVHHTRKQQADDKFDMISGTNGLMGAADGAFLLQKEKRTSNSATLDISGRDQQDQRLHLTKDIDRLIWQLERAETELWKEPPDPILDAVAALVTTEQPEWYGTPTELVERAGLDIKPNTLSLRLNVKASRLLNEYRVRYENNRTHSGRYIKLSLVP